MIKSRILMTLPLLGAIFGTLLGCSRDTLSKRQLFELRSECASIAKRNTSPAGSYGPGTSISYFRGFYDPDKNRCLLSGHVFTLLQPQNGEQISMIRDYLLKDGQTDEQLAGCHEVPDGTPGGKTECAIGGKPASRDQFDAYVKKLTGDATT